MRFTKSLLIATITVAAPFISHATPVAVTTDPTLALGGLTFDSFTCSISKGGVLSTPSSCGQINVGTITSPVKGIEFSSGFNAGFGSFDDAVLHYNVSSKAGIDQIGLNFNGDFMGLAISSVVETVFSDGKQIAQATVSCSALGCNDSANIALNGYYNDLSVEKDVYVGASYLGDATISTIDQTFSTAPEPSSFAMLGGALIGAAGLLRRRAKLSVQKASV